MTVDIAFFPEKIKKPETGSADFVFEVRMPTEPNAGRRRTVIGSVRQFGAVSVEISRKKTLRGLHSYRE